MKKVVQMKNLDCAHCAGKIEQAIAKIEGVKSVHINFMLQKMTLECNESVFATIIEQAKAICKKIEPHCTLEI